MIARGSSSPRPVHSLRTSAGMSAATLTGVSSSTRTVPSADADDRRPEQHRRQSRKHPKNLVLSTRVQHALNLAISPARTKQERGPCELPHSPAPQARKSASVRRASAAEAVVRMRTLEPARDVGAQRLLGLLEAAQVDAAPIEARSPSKSPISFPFS